MLLGETSLDCVGVLGASRLSGRMESLLIWLASGSITVCASAEVSNSEVLLLFSVRLDLAVLSLHATIKCVEHWSGRLLSAGFPPIRKSWHACKCRGTYR